MKDHLLIATLTLPLLCACSSLSEMWQVRSETQAFLDVSGVKVTLKNKQEYELEIPANKHDLQNQQAMQQVARDLLEHLRPVIKNPQIKQLTCKFFQDKKTSTIGFSRQTLTVSVQLD